MKAGHRSQRVFGFLFCSVLSLSFSAAAQDLTPPALQRLVVHSNVLNEDRTIWVRMPRSYDRDKVSYPVLYLMDGPGHINEIGSTIDFLGENNRVPPMIVVGIANTDRVRDLTPTHWDMKRPDGTVNANPTSGGGEHFLDFIQKELMPQIEKRYRTSCYRVFAGHSLGGLMVIHTLITRPDLFQAYIAVSPSLQWDNQHTLHQAQQFFAEHAELKKALFFSLGNEGNTPNPMGDGFEQLQKTLATKAPKGFHWDSSRYPDETHSSTVLRAHYAGLRTVFADWQAPVSSDNGFPVGGMAGVEKHYHDLSERYGCAIQAPESLINQLGYRLMGDKKLDEAIAAFQRNVELYPGSANVYDSLGEGYENAGKLDLAIQNIEKAIAKGTGTGDPDLDQYKAHLKSVEAAKAAAEKAAGPK
ncbi:MAG TPA: alpha/beta hydrolase-fold protein [Candidatus Acidoferrum sp.]|nr:alpha/beta hydrolase-fold protein [Candidatus Acidoferrum sp.]